MFFPRYWLAKLMRCTHCDAEPEQVAERERMRRDAERAHRIALDRTPELERERESSNNSGK
eukprot:12348953-Prorocentrum_lima.AAC.1